jgi:Na+-translocating ferredoxin:NAD+ oxidoreductase RnfC subunit
VATDARAALAHQVYAAGVIGAGGAGFPTHKKLASDVSLLVVNAAECEPLLASDRYAMRHFAVEIVRGIQAFRAALGSCRVVLGTKSKYAREIAALEEAIQAEGTDIEIHGVDGFYPAGDEQVLIYEITGQAVPPGGIPLDLGIVVINVTTAMNVYRATQDVPVTRHFVTVTGEVATPCVVDAPIGASAADLIAAAGGATVSGRYAIVEGGPMMGRLHPRERAAQLGYGKASGGLIVLPENHPLIEFVAQPIERVLKMAQSACIQCALCTDMCPRFLIGHRIRPHRVMRAVGNATGGPDLLDALACCECGICELFACPMGLSPRRVNVYVKAMLRADGQNKPNPRIYAHQAAERDYRMIDQSRFISKLQLNAYPRSLDNLVTCEPAKVYIPRRQGIGKPAGPQVKVGQRVEVGDVIGGVEEADMGALIHASIAGTVTEIAEQHIVIQREGSVAS